MKPANDYAYRQVMGALPRRGAKVDVSPDGLTVTGTFANPDAAEFSWAAFGSKYPKHNVTVSRDENTLTFQFAPARNTSEGKETLSVIRITESKLRELIRTMIHESSDESPKQEQLSDQVALEALTDAFTMRVEMGEDIEYIRYLVRPNSIGLQDYDGMLGNMDTGFSAADLKKYFNTTPKALGDWLAAHGARAIKPKRRKRNDPFRGPMGGYD